jgi:protein adenylyltransferase
MGSMSHVDEPVYISGEFSEEQRNDVIKHGERIIEAAGDEFKSLFIDEYKELMAKVIPFATLVTAETGIPDGARE